MRSTFLVCWPGPPRPGRGGGLFLARFARLTLVGKSIDRQVASPADLPTKAT